MHEAMKSIIKETDSRWVFRQFPIPGHPLASKAAEASECAGEQGKFWEYSDSLFELKGPMSEGTFPEIAQDLGLDRTTFSKCLTSGKNVSAVATQHEDGVKNKITGTPTFYINGKRFDGFVPLEELRNLMEAHVGNEACK
jgi:protein-disulfide isomerase